MTEQYNLTGEIKKHFELKDNLENKSRINYYEWRSKNQGLQLFAELGGEDRKWSYIYVSSNEFGKEKIQDILYKIEDLKKNNKLNLENALELFKEYKKSD
jgi:hypothetical protein